MSTHEILKKVDINNGLVKYDIETNHNFNFNDSMLVDIHD